MNRRRRLGGGILWDEGWKWQFNDSLLAWISASSTFTFNWTEKNSNSCVCSGFDQTAQLRQVEAPNAWNWSLAWFWMDSCMILNGQHPKFAAIPITNEPALAVLALRWSWKTSCDLTRCASRPMALSRCHIHAAAAAVPHSLYRSIWAAKFMPWHSCCCIQDNFQGAIRQQHSCSTYAIAFTQQHLCCRAQTVALFRSQAAKLKQPLSRCHIYAAALHLSIVVSSSIQAQLLFSRCSIYAAACTPQL